MKNSGKYVSVQLLNLLLSYAAANNYDTVSVLQKAGISSEVLIDKNTRIDIDRFLSVASAVAGMAGNGFTGPRLAEKINSLYSKNHILMAIMSNCETLEQAVEKLIRYHDISSNAIRLQLEKQGKSTALIFKTEIPAHTGFDGIFQEAALASFAMMFREFTLGKVRFEEIRFAHSGPEDKTEYARIFNCPVIFGSGVDKIVFPNEDLLLPVAMSDPELLDMLERYAQRILSEQGPGGGALPEKVMNLMGERILQGKDCNVGSIAKSLTVSIRTLQKQLKAENTSYRRLLEQVKKSIAIKSLENRESQLSDVAFLLGFSEQSSFNHAFKGWTGLSPRQYKKRNGEKKHAE